MKCFIDCNGIIYSIYGNSKTNHPVGDVNIIEEKDTNFVELCFSDGMVFDTYVLHDSLSALEVFLNESI